MLASLVSSKFEAKTFHHSGYGSSAPLQYICTPDTACSSSHDSRSSSSYSYCSRTSNNCDFTSSGTTTCRSSCTDTTSMSASVSQYASMAQLYTKPHKAQDIAWLAIHSLKLRGEEISMASLKVLCKLGHGDSGSVYLTQLRGTSCHFALKVVDKEQLSKKNKIHRMHMEKEILELVHHPFLPTLYAHFEIGHFSCLLMEFCPGGDLHTLRHRQSGKRFGLKLVRFYAAQLLVALEYLHMLGIVYRDLKPENVLVKENGHIMLTDFDLCARSCTSEPARPTRLPTSCISSRSKRRLVRRAFTSCKPIHDITTGSTWKHEIWTSSWIQRRIQHLKARRRMKKDAMYVEMVVEPFEIRATSMVGTHEYLAPEVISKCGHGSAVDWWMLGILVYELLFGRTPFKGFNNKHTLHNIANQELRFPQNNEEVEVGRACKEFLQGLLTKDPSKRLGSTKGASEIKQHPFFKGVNWALVCTTKAPSFNHAIFQQATRLSSLYCNHQPLHRVESNTHSIVSQYFELF